MIFVDTSAWFGCVVPSDNNYLSASRWFAENNQPLLTESDIRETWQVFQIFSDKEWSFTDCSSKVVMSKLEITMAFAFDHHFNQFGSVAVLPTYST